MDSLTMDMGIRTPNEVTVRLTEMLFEVHPCDETRDWMTEAASYMEALEEGDLTDQAQEDLDEIWLEATQHEAVEIAEDGGFLWVHDPEVEIHNDDSNDIELRHVAQWGELYMPRFGGGAVRACQEPGCRMVQS